MARQRPRSTKTRSALNRNIAESTVERRREYEDVRPGVETLQQGYAPPADIYDPVDRSYQFDQYGRRSPFDESIAGRPSDVYQASEPRWGYSQTFRRAGPFAGRGPKGWRRPDDRIHDDVCEALTRNPYVDASEIEISVKNGEVTLSGTVDDRDQKRVAALIADFTPGVRDVHNRPRLAAPERRARRAA
jgi:hypothetical protein